MSISLSNVTYTYMPGTPYEQPALKDISLTIPLGQFVGIIGHTGSGKSTLIQHMNGLLHPSIGTVMLDEVDLKGKSAQAKQARRRIGMVFQYPEHQLFEETVAADIAFGPRNLGLTDSEVEERVHYAMNFVNLDYANFASRSPFELSGGQMRRVAIAGVVALRPDYLILDEPSAGLDPGGRKEIFAQIVNYYQSARITVILVSHNMDEVAQVVNRLIVMDHGRILIDGSPAQVFGKERDKLRQAGVDVPPVTSLMTLLAAKGLAVDSSLIRLADAVENICEALKNGGRRHVK
jgi:energy-coupling factor transport system ATP-binding protein